MLRRVRRRLRWRRGLAVGVWLTTVFGLERSGHAAPASPPRIAVIAADAEVDRRLVGELHFLGFDAKVVTSPSGRAPQDLSALARRLDVAAAIAVDQDGHQVVVWIVDRMTGKLVARVLDLATTDDAPREIAVRAVELLHASLAEVAMGRPAPEAEVPVTAASRGMLRPTDPRWGAAVGVLVGGAPGGTPVAVHARAHVRFMPHRTIGLLLQGTAPLTAMTIATPEGTIRVHAGWVALGPRVVLRPPQKRVVPEITATVGPVFIRMEGDAAPGFRGTRDRVVDALFEADVALEIALTARLRLRGEAGVAVCAREIGIRAGGRTAATWCRPHGLGSLALGGVW